MAKKISWKKITVFIALVFFTAPLFCEVVTSEVLTSKYGVSYAERQKSNYIEKNGYSFRYLGNGSWDIKALSYGNNNNYGGVNKNIIIIAVIASVIHIILTKCVYNMKGGNWACFYFFLTPIALLGLLLFLFKDVGGIKRNPNHIIITHRKG